jgi:hypothetical protein
LDLSYLIGKEDQINRDFYETMCAFFDLSWGTFLLGERNSGERINLRALFFREITFKLLIQNEKIGG